jgi:DNA-directed RNA polymerase specialized sigma24 family protein
MANIKKLIEQAVAEGLKAGRKQAERAPIDAYRATERRLYALPALAIRIQNAKEKLQDLRENGLHERSKDFIRFHRSGRRQTPDDICNMLIMDIEASIAADEEEIETVKNALVQIESDPYYPAVKGRYMENQSDKEIAEQLYCDERTVRRHRSRLVQIVAIQLYGADAV